MKKILIAAAASTALFSSAAFAQSATDSVDFVVGGTVNQECSIADPTDASFGAFEIEEAPGSIALKINNGSQTASTQNIWVSCNYAAEISGASANGGMTNSDAGAAALVANDSADFTDVIEYRVRLTSTDGSFPLFEMQTDGPGSTGPVVAGGAFHNQATLKVYVDGDDNPKRPVAGTYSDTATLTVGPV